MCVTSARKVSSPIMASVNKELQSMLEAGVVCTVTEPTEWCAQMVPGKRKYGNICICVDLKQLIKPVCIEHYRLPSLDDVAPNLAGSKYFSKLDAESRFCQIPLESESQLSTTFMTPFGRHAF